MNKIPATIKVATVLDNSLPFSMILAHPNPPGTGKVVTRCTRCLEITMFNNSKQFVIGKSKCYRWPMCIHLLQFAIVNHQTQWAFLQ
jgi:hypothetical protein